MSNTLRDMHKVLTDRKIEGFFKSLGRGAGSHIGDVNTADIDRIFPDQSDSNSSRWSSVYSASDAPMSPNTRPILKNEILQGVNQFDKNLDFDFNECGRQSFYLNLQQLELETKEIQSRNRDFGSSVTVTQKNAFEALLQHQNVFLKTFDFKKRLLGVLLAIRLKLANLGLLLEFGKEALKIGKEDQALLEDQFVLYLGERRGSPQVKHVVEVAGMSGKVVCGWKDKSGVFYSLGRGQRVERIDDQFLEKVKGQIINIYSEIYSDSLMVK